jgi:hypothetical protein
MSSDAPLLEDDLLEPQLRSCKSQMYRARSQNMPPLPATREDINLEGQWALTNDNQQFLLHQDDDMVLFATDNNLEMLYSWTAPSRYLLHIIYMGFFIPIVYALLKDKSSDTYYHFFQHNLLKFVRC